MKPKEYKIRNLGAINSLQGTFPDNGVVYIVADNGGGKSTFIRTFRDFLSAGSNEGKLTRGERSGEWEQTFIAANGGEYLAKFDLDPTTGERLTIVTPEGKIMKKIGEIKDLFGSPDWSIEEFIPWGLTAEGRKKQASILFKLLPKETQVNYANLGIDETKAFEDRTFKNRILKEKEGALTTSKPTSEDIQKAMQYTKYYNQEQNILHELDGMGDVRTQLEKASAEYTAAQVLAQSLTQKIEDKTSDYTELKKEIEEMLEQIKAKQLKLKAIQDDGMKLRQEVKSANVALEAKALVVKEQEKLRATLAETEEQLATAQTSMRECNVAQTDVKRYEELEIEVEGLKKETKTLDAKILKLREDKVKLFEKSNLPVKDLIIEDGELFVLKGKDKFKFNEEEMCTSELLVKGIEIALASHPKTKILFLFNANLLNSAKRKELDALAKHLDYLFILELVDETKDGIQLIAHEDLD